MCGICGKISADNANNIDERLIRNMCKVLAHRGPDDEGVYIYPLPWPSPQRGEGTKVGLGHRRLSIIDLSAAGHQPMSNEDGTIWIVMNGEIYNFPGLKHDLEKKGHHFKSHTDTEVILHLYEDRGMDCVKDLRGMFAFAIWDERKERLFIARDRVGKKPLYYFYKNRTLVFGSEIKAILQDPEITAEVNREAITDYLSYGYTPNPATMFKNIIKLPPAHTMRYENGKIKTERYWKLDFSTKTKFGERECCDTIMHLLEEATRIRLISDVPLGVFLSGGIDSSMIVYMMSRIKAGVVKTFSIGFEERSHSELKYAAMVARHFGTKHHEYIVNPDMIEILPKLVWHYNEPYADSSALPSYYVAKMTRQEVKVALNGDGGDENFGGYERFMAARYAELFKKMPAAFQDKLTAFASKILPESLEFNKFSTKLKRFILMAAKPYDERHYNWISVFRDMEKSNLFTEEFRKEVNDKPSFYYLDNVFKECGAKNVLDRVMCADIQTYLLEDLLVKMDVATMANSLEGRSPFLDHKVMEFAATIPGRMKIKGMKLKYIIKKALRGKLPDEILSRGKMGFGIPIDKWFRGELKDYSQDILMSDKCIGRNYFKKENIARLLSDHYDSKANNGARIWSLLNLELWHRVFLDKDIKI